MIQDTQYTNRPLALTMTLLFHALVFIAFYLLVMRTNVPPYPVVGGGSGLEVNFGTSDEGMGEVQPEEYYDVETQPLPPQADVIGGADRTSQDEEELLTQDREEAPVIAKNKPKQAVKPSEGPVINDPVINKKALYPGKSKGGNEGETGTPGDQGHPQGSLYSKNHYGEPGSGLGTGSGFGTGTGSGDGSGPSFSLSGRQPNYLPKPEYQGSDVGTVVIEIKVDKEGNVVQADWLAKMSNTTNSALIQIAKKAALKARFNRDTKATEIQKGTITYRFVL